jgi:uncharacterized protein YigE (DUF2233 family)
MPSFKYRKVIAFAGLMVQVAISSGSSPITTKNQIDDQIISYTVDPKKQDVQFYWKNDDGEIFRNIQRLKDYLIRKNRKLVFAMNGGMFKADNSPVGLFIEHRKVITQIDTSSGEGNFYLKPNGILYIDTNNKAGVCRTTAFSQGSTNVNIRNAVGILPGNKLLFAMSRIPINFYAFASWFKSKGCDNALYLDGFVSKIYLPEKQCEQMDGNLGVIIGSSVSY